MSAASVRLALGDWADERDAARRGGGELAAFARLIAGQGTDADLERLEELVEFHRAEEALG